MKPLSNSGMLIGALLVGTAIGGAIGVLLAPDKGDRTRKKLSARGDDLTTAMKEKLNGYIEEAEKDAKKFRAKTREIIDLGAAKAKRLKTR